MNVKDTQTLYMGDSWLFLVEEDSQTLNVKSLFLVDWFAW